MACNTSLLGNVEENSLQPQIEAKLYCYSKSAITENLSHACSTVNMYLDSEDNIIAFLKVLFNSHNEVLVQKVP